MILAKSIRLQGIYCGSKQMLQGLNRAYAANEVKPVVDKVYAFNDAPQAFRDMQSAKHFGKLVVEI